jgi:AP-3 complex subunit mu
VNAIPYRVSATLPTGQLSNVPWRRTGVKYTNNEAYFDVIEEIDAIIDKQGNTVIAEVQGYVGVQDDNILQPKFDIL